jgi:hypothetical protein
MDGTVRALAVFEDANGPALYAGGFFRNAGGVNTTCIAKWDGKRWWPLSNGIAMSVASPSVTALAVVQVGSSRALYAGGTFSTAGGVSANSIARWNGATWAALGSGLSGPNSVYALAEYNDGSGPALYAGGVFSQVGGISAAHIAKWNGASWSALGSGVGGQAGPSVHTLCPFDDGTGTAIYVGGTFTTAGGQSANRIARWNGSTWSTLGTGFNGPVWSLAVYDDDTGPALYATGDFTTAGGAPANRIAKWTGSVWTALGTGLKYNSGGGRALCVFDDGGGPHLYVGGFFDAAGDQPIHAVARWDGHEWSSVNVDPLAHGVFALVPYDSGSGSTLHSGSASGVLKWNQSAWTNLTQNGVNDIVSALQNFDDGRGPAIYAGGIFTRAGQEAAASVARWDGISWSALGSGLPGASVRAMEVHDDGNGEALYVGGYIPSAGGATANSIARWRGNWSSLGEGLTKPGSSAAVYSLVSGNIGEGPSLYAAGEFTRSGSLTVNRIARWDGSQWHALGAGVDGTIFTSAVHDFQGQPNLFIGGQFTTAGTSSAKHVARWDGSSWYPVGDQLDGLVEALTSFNDGQGQALYAGGAFTRTATNTLNRVAKWDGTAWNPVGAGFANNTVSAFTIFNDGTGAALYAGGSFTFSGGSAVRYLARWNGSSWIAAAQGLDHSVNTFSHFLSAGRLSLFVGGRFASAGLVGAGHIGQWLTCGAQPGDLDGDAVVDQRDIQYFSACATGPTIPYTIGSIPPMCTLLSDPEGFLLADFDRDGDIDQEDFGIMQRCYNGSRPANLQCAD